MPTVKATVKDRFAFLPRFRYEEELAAGTTVELLGEEARHALRVRRLRPGDAVALVDGRGTTARGELLRLTNAGVLVELSEVARNLNELPQRIILYQALVKHRRFENALAMTTALGVAAIIPLLSERSIARPNPERLHKYQQRWSKLAWEEVKVAERSVVPAIGSTVDLPIAITCGACDYKIILTPRKGVPALDRLVERLHIEPGERLALIIGPEGDFTEEEYESAIAAGCQPASLGDRLLRSEYAGIMAVAATLVGLGALEEYP
ncbi:RsmE family RNA methyltransferase [bacterium]|nr:RsmE family RNA methyltransferase [bacterium]